MAYGKHMHLVTTLAKLTKLGRIDWESTIDYGTFQVSFKNYTVRIFSKAGMNAENDVIVQLLNEEGLVAESFTDIDLNNDSDNTQDDRAYWYNTMVELYTYARRRALGVDKILDEIISSLEART